MNIIKEKYIENLKSGTLTVEESKNAVRLVEEKIGRYERKAKRIKKTMMYSNDDERKYLSKKRDKTIEKEYKLKEKKLAIKSAIKEVLNVNKRRERKNYGGEEDAIDRRKEIEEYLEEKSEKWGNGSRIENGIKDDLVEYFDVSKSTISNDIVILRKINEY